MSNISVILPVYNGGEYLKLSVQSILSQTYSGFEFFILDDCSTDGSFEYLKSLSDPRIRLSRNASNLGLFPNLNILIGKSKSPLIKIWSQDDIMYPNCLQAICHFHDIYPNLGFSYSQCDYIDEVGKLTPYFRNDDTPEIVSRHLHTRIAYFTGSIAGNIANVCLVRSAIERVGLFDESMKISGDFFMWVKLAEHFNTGFIKIPLIQLRNHTGQLSRNETFYWYHIKEDLKVYRYLDAYATNEERVEGRKNLMQYKLLFYYILMVKATCKGRISAASAMKKELREYCSIWPIRRNFIRFILLKQKRIPFQALP